MDWTQKTVRRRISDEKKVDRPAFAGCNVLSGVPFRRACAEEKTEKETRQVMQETMEQVLEGIDFSGTQEITLTLPGWEEGISVEQAVRALASGGQRIGRCACCHGARRIF